MQRKIDKLVEIIQTMKSLSQRNYATKLLSEIVDAMNNQSSVIKDLHVRKFDIKPGEVDTELDKYILLLITYGYTQDNIRLLNFDTLKFIAENVDHLKRKPLFTDVYKIQNWIMAFEFDRDRKPESMVELKEFVEKECS